jgi:hypothetical protein
MRRTSGRWPWLVSAAALTLAFFVVAGSGAVGATSGTVSLDVTGFAFHADTTHFAGTGDVCQTQTAPAAGREFQGTGDGVGGFIGNVDLPQGARISAFRVSARDNDADVDVHAYLVRKRLAPSTGDGFGGYNVLASVASSGSSTTLRRFSTTNVSGGRVDTATFAYFAELVNCADTVDPIGVQVLWTM